MRSESGSREKLDVLMLEDNPADARLNLHKLTETGFEICCDVARTSDEFKRQLESHSYALILGDYRIPTWTGLDAIRWVRASGINSPFVLVTGTLGDELAIECIKAGADDYVLKDNLDRLPIVVKRVLAEHAMRLERDRAETELREAEEQYRLLFQASPHPMWVFDNNTLRFLAVNNAAIRHYGYSLRDFFSMSVSEIRPREDIERFVQSVERQRERHSLESYGELWKHKKKDGTIIDVEISSQPIKFRGIDAQLVLAHDVTDRLTLEREFRQAQKMEAIGRLAGGVAHDFNNLLMVISGFTQLIAEQEHNNEKIGKYVPQVLTAVQRATALTKQLLAFSRKQIQELRVLDLNNVLTDFCKMLPSLIGEDVEMRVRPSSEECAVYSDKGQIEQVVMNLAVNARDAMPDGGLLTIETDRVNLDATYFQKHDAEVKPGEYVMLAITDTGTGMTPSVQSHLFEPFFTTKEVGKGTGLGLSTIYGIVKQCNGYIWVYSEIAKGTTFKVFFPCVTAEVDAATSSPVQEVETRGIETILLVEDEAALRTVTSEFLESKGYHLLQAGDGLEALRVSQAHERDIDLLLTDVIIPGLRGIDVAERIRAERPDIAIVYMSGYTELGAQEQGIQKSDGFLQKPFSLLTLSTTIRRALDNRKASTTGKSTSRRPA
jgi:two-component system, cell cycle sensor histidine kinase and response regulator CckA